MAALQQHAIVKASVHLCHGLERRTLGICAAAWRLPSSASVTEIEMNFRLRADCQKWNCKK
jgi:hypothetical protein